MSSPTRKRARSRLLELESHSNFWPGDLVFNSALLSMTYPTTAYKTPVFTRVRKFTRKAAVIQLLQARLDQTRPLQPLDPAARDLSGITLEKQALVVGFAPIDYDYLGRDAVYKPENPYRQWFQLGINATASRYCSDFRTLKFNDHVALVVAQFEHAQTASGKVVFHVLLDPDSEGIMVGYRVAKEQVFYLPQYRNDFASGSTMTEVCSSIIREVLRQHYARVQEADKRRMPAYLSKPLEDPQAILATRPPILRAPPTFCAQFQNNVQTPLTPVSATDNRALCPQLTMPPQMSPETAWERFSRAIIQPIRDREDALTIVRYADVFMKELPDHQQFGSILSYEVMQLNTAAMARGSGLSHPSLVYDFVKMLRNGQLFGWPPELKTNEDRYLWALDTVECIYRQQSTVQSSANAQQEKTQGKSDTGHGVVPAKGPDGKDAEQGKATAHPKDSADNIPTDPSRDGGQA